MWLATERDRHRGRDADEDQQRRHQEAAADPEHAGDEADRSAHRQDEQHIDRNVGDREIRAARAFASEVLALSWAEGRSGRGSVVWRRDGSLRAQGRPRLRTISSV